LSIIGIKIYIQKVGNLKYGSVYKVYLTKMSTRIAFPLLEPPHKAKFEFKGLVGDRIAVNQKNWLLLAPTANPGMLNMFCNRESNRDLLPWSGEFAGKYLISAVQSFRLTQDEQLKETIQVFVNKLISCQEASGYLGPFSVAERAKPQWDLWGQYHCMLGLYLWYREISDEKPLAACVKGANHLCNTYMNTGVAIASPPNWEEVNEACIHILTLLCEDNNAKVDPNRQLYRRMIQKIEDEWIAYGDYVSYFQQPTLFYNCNRPRWETLHIVQAIAELYYVTGEEKYRKAFAQIWWSILAGDRHNTGGFTSGEQATGNPYDPRPIETCGTIAWMALTIDMLRLSADSRAADELELSTWNAVLGAQNEDGSWWTYNTPMGGIPPDGMDKMSLPSPLDVVPRLLGERRSTTLDLGWQAREGSPQLSCCSANGPRGLGMLSEWAVMISEDGIVLNYYGPSVFSVQTPSGKNVRLEQITDYPVSGKVSLTITPESEESFILRMRIPGWSKKTEVKINGQPQQNPIQQGTYLFLNRLWRPGDKIDIILDISPRFLLGESPPGNSKGEGSAAGKVSIYHGPLLLTYDPRFDIHAADQLPFIDMTSIVQLQIRESSLSDDTGLRPFLLAQFDTLDRRTIKLCDFASAGADRPYVSWLPAIDKIWQFSRLDGSQIAKSVRLLQDKRIEGASPINEATWGFEGDALVFYSNDSKPSTRFTSASTINGRMILQGQFLFDTSITHILTEMDWGITNKIWQFVRRSGNSSNDIIIANGIRLLADWNIEGYSDDNESKWGFEGDILVFYHKDGRRSTRFTSVNTTMGKFSNVPFNGLLLQGQFLFDTSITHFLVEMGTWWGPSVESSEHKAIQPYLSFKIPG
jgi:uncharacterized protein